MNNSSTRLFVVLLLCLSFFQVNIYAKDGEDKNVKLNRRPQIGDLCIINNEKFRFVRKNDINLLDANLTKNAIGVVYYVKGRNAKVVGLQTSEPVRWSNVTLFAVTHNRIPERSIELPVYLLTMTRQAGLFDYHFENGSVQEFIKQLNKWFISNKQKGWSAYMNGDNGIIQYTGIVDDYTGYDLMIGDQRFFRVTTSFAGVDIQETYCRNQVLQNKWVCGINRKRMEEHCRNGKGRAFYPSDEVLIDGKKTLYEIVPVSEEYYNISNTLRKKFRNYAAYLDACMVKLPDDKNGIMQFKSGREITEKLSKVIITSDEEKNIPAFPAAYFAHNYKSTVDMNNLEWWLPSMYELALIMRRPEVINIWMAANPQWDEIKDDRYYWSCCPNNTYYVWFYHFDGMSDANNMCGADKNGNLFIKAIPVTEINY